MEKMRAYFHQNSLKDKEEISVKFIDYQDGKQSEIMFYLKDEHGNVKLAIGGILNIPLNSDIQIELGEKIAEIIKRTFNEGLRKGFEQAVNLLEANTVDKEDLKISF